MKYLADQEVIALYKFEKNRSIAALFAIFCLFPFFKSHSQEVSKLDTTLSISTAQLRSSTIPDSIFLMTHLRHLTITGMDCDYAPHPNCWMISEIPAKLKNLRELTTFRLTLSAILVIPHELTELKYLKLLDLTDGTLANANLDNISEITSLEYLYLYGCGLSKLPTDIGRLASLKELGLSGNNFTSAEQARIRKALPRCKITF